MAGFRITKPYTMPKDEIRAVAEDFAEELAAEYGVSSRWDGDRVRISGSGVNGEMNIAGGLVDISVKLGLLTSVFEGRLRREVERYLEEHVS